MIARVTPDYIESRWQETLNDSATLIDVAVSGYVAYAIRGHNGEVSVAIPFDSDKEINEEFNSVRLSSCVMSIGGINSKLLMLAYSGHQAPHSFGALCSEFVDPGANGELRDQLVASPVEWWRSWKELLGNRNVENRVYDVIAELMVLLWLHRGVYENIDWRGPDCSSYDIHTKTDLFEVKASLVKSEKRISVHNKFQLDAGPVPLHIVFCQMEPSTAGVSINMLADKIAELNLMSVEALERKLSRLGFERGRSDRSTKFKLLAMEKYDVGDDFPTIDPVPLHIVDLECVVDLAGLPFSEIEWSL